MNGHLSRKGITNLNMKGHRLLWVKKTPSKYRTYKVVGEVVTLCSTSQLGMVSVTSGEQLPHPTQTRDHYFWGVPILF